MADESIRTNMKTIQLCTKKLLNPSENESNIRHFRHVIESLKTDIRQMNELKKKWN